MPGDLQQDIDIIRVLVFGAQAEIVKFSSARNK
jgi:hypothetical protein